LKLPNVKDIYREYYGHWRSLHNGLIIPPLYLELETAPRKTIYWRIDHELRLYCQGHKEGAIMTILNRIAKNLLRLAGFDVERLAGDSLLFFAQKQRGEIWFSYNTQLQKLFDEESIDLVLDVGANKGQFAEKIRSFYLGTILSFEPVSSVFERLQKAASSDPNWHVYNCALGSQECTQEINVSDETMFSSLLKSNEYCAKRFGEYSLGKHSERVSVRRAENVLEEIAPKIRGNRIFLKMDTQGYDTVVFEGLGSALERIVLLQSEVSLLPIYDGMPHWTESLSLYERNGFSVVGMFPVNRDSSRVLEYDCLMIRHK
jgi:FkbM family methyltransferase